MNFLIYLLIFQANIIYPKTIPFRNHFIIINHSVPFIYRLELQRKRAIPRLGHILFVIQFNPRSTYQTVDFSRFFPFQYRRRSHPDPIVRAAIHISSKDNCRIRNFRLIKLQCISSTLSHYRIINDSRLCCGIHAYEGKPNR